jgi:chemotaxis protein CheD
MQAKIFGGAHVVDSPQLTARHVGEGNIELAKETMATLKIPITALDVGGREGRKLIFRTDTGTVWTKNI